MFHWCGDIVEIPLKADRADELSLWPTLRETLEKCLARDITVTAQGDTATVHLALTHVLRLDRSFTGRSFWLKELVSDFTLRFRPPIDTQRMLERFQKGLGVGPTRISYDLKQVMVVRKSPETGEDWKVIFDIDGYGDIEDLHLKNNDAIFALDKE